jgi:hypothetical protein
MIRHLIVFSLLATFTAHLAPPSHAQSEPKGKTAKEKKYPTVAGYQKRTLAGFTVFLHEDVLKRDAKDEKLPAASAVELELKNITRMMPKKYAELLQAQVPVWVNWDLDEPLSNGRQGRAAGAYTGVYPRPIRVDGKDITVFGVRLFMAREIVERLREDPEALPSPLLLHEFAHAVHDLALDANNVTISAAFKQALERKLYDTTLYMTTNDKEFFAELSCSYLMRLGHFPKNHEELKKHDPATYKIMESIWGKKADKEASATASGSGGSKFDVDIPRDSFEFGDPVLHALADPAKERGRVVVLYFWDAAIGESLFGLMRLNVLYDELRDYGAVFIGSGGFPGRDIRFVGREAATAGQLKSAAQTRGIRFPVYLSAKSPGANDCRSLPHCVVFDSEGTCVFRGTPFEAETVIRATLNKSILADVKKESYLPVIAPVVKQMEAGEPTPAMMKKLVQINQTGGGAVVDESKAVLEQFVRYGREQIKEAEGQLKTDPVAAYLSLDRIATVFKGTSLASKATQHIDGNLRSNKSVLAEMRAKPTMESIRKLDVTLTGRPGSFDPSLPRFQSENGASLSQLKEQVEKVKKQAPGTKALEEALLIAEKYQVTIK